MEPYLFGPLPSFRAAGDGWTIEPVEDFRKADASLRRYTIDGAIHPPILRAESNRTRKNSRSDRPATMFYLPATHALRIEESLSAPEPDRLLATIAILSAGFLFRTRVQFSDWRHEGRIPRGLPSIHNHASEIAPFLSSVVATARAASRADRRVLASLFFLHARAGSRDFTWEQLLHRYPVVDGVWRLRGKQVAEERGLRRPKDQTPHGRRIAMMLEALGMWHNAELIEQIVRHRNNLFHETTWADHVPGIVVDREAARAAVAAVENLRRLCERLICAAIGWFSPFTRSRWNSLSAFSFSRETRPGERSTGA